MCLSIFLEFLVLSITCCVLKGCVLRAPSSVRGAEPAVRGEAASGCRSVSLLTRERSDSISWTSNSGTRGDYSLTLLFSLFSRVINTNSVF